nr:OmpA family protein [Granulosicoccus sp.]
HTISKIGDFMKSYPEKTALIEGHTDSHGGEDFNYDLSVRRTGAVRAALIREGIAPSRISTKGFGEALPVASNNTSSGRQQNRRVEIIFTEAGQRMSALSQ